MTLLKTIKHCAWTAWLVRVFFEWFLPTINRLILENSGRLETRRVNYGHRRVIIIITPSLHFRSRGALSDVEIAGWQEVWKLIMAMATDSSDVNGDFTSLSVHLKLAGWRAGKAKFGDDSWEWSSSSSLPNVYFGSQWAETVSFWLNANKAN